MHKEALKQSQGASCISSPLCSGIANFPLVFQVWSKFRLLSFTTEAASTTTAPEQVGYDVQSLFTLIDAVVKSEIIIHLTTRVTNKR